MKKYFLILLLNSPSMAEVDPVNLVLTDRGEFAEIFDSGLRPVRQPGMANSMCVVNNVNINLTLDDTSYPSLNAEYLRIRVLKNHLLSSVEMVSGSSLTRNEAMHVAEEWGVPKDMMNTERWLHEGWLIGVNNEKWKAGAGFRRTYDETKPWRFGVAIQWKRPVIEMTLHEGLLPSPPGYEHISMEANNLPSDVNDQTVDPYNGLKNHFPGSKDNQITNSKIQSRRTLFISNLLLFIILVIIIGTAIIWRIRVKK